MVLKKNKDLRKGGTDSSSDEEKRIPKIRSLKEIYGSDSDSSKEKPMEDCKKATRKFKLRDDAKKLKSLLSTSGSQLTMDRKQYPRSTGIRIDDKRLSSIENTNSSGRPEPDLITRQVRFRFHLLRKIPSSGQVQVWVSRPENPTDLT